MLRRAAVVLLASVVAGGAIRLVDPGVIRLVPGERAWARSVSGATPSGRVLARALVRLPGLGRADPGRALLELEEARAEIRVGIDGEALREVRASGEGEVVLGLPARSTPSAVIELVRVGTPITVRAITVSSPVSFWPGALAVVFVALWTSYLLDRASTRVVLAAALAMAACLALPFASARLWLPVALLVVGGLLGWRSRFFWVASALGASLVFGLWVRLYFLPSAGSWDTEYWKAWMTRAVDHGTVRVYGDPDAVPEGELFDHLWGRTELWRASYRGREFVVDYPPLAMALWRWSFLAVKAGAPWLEYGEAENVAVKLPPVIGDVLAVSLLLWFFRRERALSLTLAALYWIVPVSWLSSAVLGFLDGAYAPFAVGALVAASAGRAGWSGALLAVAALIKPQALIVAPAAAVALVRVEAPLRRAVGAGLTVVGVALVPFWLAGTLDEAVTHVFRILFQQRLSAGYANPWWLVGQFLSDAPFASKDLVPFSGVLAVGAFVVAAAYVLWRERDAAIAGGGLVFAYAMLALGVHHNHPHVMFLAFAAAGLKDRVLQWLVSLLAASYVLNMVCLSGLGRFYGTRYMALESVATSSSVVMRTALGFDLTLVLAVVNIALFGLFLANLWRRA